MNVHDYWSGFISGFFTVIVSLTLVLVMVFVFEKQTTLKRACAAIVMGLCLGAITVFACWIISDFSLPTILLIIYIAVVLAIGNGLVWSFSNLKNNP